MDSNEKLSQEPSTNVSFNPHQGQRTLTGQDILACQHMIEKCLPLYMNKHKIAESLKLAAGFDPVLTLSVYECLEKQNPEVFRWYHTRLILMKQIKTFNTHLEKMAELMRLYPNNGEASEASTLSDDTTNGAHFLKNSIHAATNEISTHARLDPMEMEINCEQQQYAIGNREVYSRLPNNEVENIASNSYNGQFPGHVASTSNNITIDTVRPDQYSNTNDPQPALPTEWDCNYFDDLFQSENMIDEEEFGGSVSIRENTENYHTQANI